MGRVGGTLARVKPFLRALRGSPHAWACRSEVAVACTLVSACVGCNSAMQRAQIVNDDDGTMPSPVAHPTYYQDVEPILRANCVDCHRADGAAPFSLTSYEQAHALATSIASVTHEQRMPPWPAVTDGDCPPQVGARRLAPPDI